MKRGGLFALACLALLSGTVSAKEKTKTLSAPIDKVFDAAVDVAKAHYTIETVDRQEHILTFHTAMGALTYGMELTVSLDAKPNGKTTVTCRPAKRGTQLFAWGQGGRIADKFLQQVSDRLEQ
jgi:hypothetical protein